MKRPHGEMPMLKKCLVIALMCFFASGCTSTAETKNFRVITDPRPQSKKSAQQLKYCLLLPAPQDKLRYQQGYCAVVPAQSNEIKFRDKTISISFGVGEQAFQMRLTNLSTHPLKILWKLADYTDVQTQRSRLMHSGIRFQDRNNPIPDQVVASGGSVQEAITPLEHVYVSSQTGAYEIMPLFNRVGDDGDGLKGKAFNLFIPIEINRTIIPYNFKIGITDVAKPTAKD